MIIACEVFQGEIRFGKIQNLKSNALEITSMSQTQRLFYKDANGLNWTHQVDFHGPAWDYLSENL